MQIDGSEFDKHYSALVTPYREGSYEVDEDGLRRLINQHNTNDYFSENGGFIINPKAGEIYYLSREERKRNVEIAVEEAEDHQKVFAGVYGVRIDELQSCCQDAIDAGADGLFVMPPQGSTLVTTELDSTKFPKVWLDHMRAIDNVGDVPLIVHPTEKHDPGNTYGGALPVEPTMRILEEFPNVVAWKMKYSMSGWKRIGKEIRSLSRHVSLLAARGYWHEAMALGYFDGTLAGAHNFSLEPHMEHQIAWENGEIDRASEIIRDLQELNEFIGSGRRHIKYKVATWLRGYIAHPFKRPPVPHPTEKEVQTILEQLRKLELDTIADARIKEVMENPVNASY